MKPIAHADQFNCYREQVFLESKEGQRVSTLLSQEILTLDDPLVLQCVEDILGKPMARRTKLEVQFLRIPLKNVAFFMELETLISSIFESKLFRYLKYEAFPAFSEIFCVGELGFDVYIILKGKVRTLVHKEDLFGGEFVDDISDDERLYFKQNYPQMALLENKNMGDVLGEIALRHRISREVTAIASEETSVAKISRFHFKVCLGQYFSMKKDQELCTMRNCELFQDWKLSEIEIALSNSYHFSLKKDKIISSVSKDPTKQNFYFIVLEGELEVVTQSYQNQKEEKVEVLEKEEVKKGEEEKKEVQKGEEGEVEEGKGQEGKGQEGEGEETKGEEINIEEEQEDKGEHKKEGDIEKEDNKTLLEEGVITPNSIDISPSRKDSVKSNSNNISPRQSPQIIKCSSILEKNDEENNQENKQPEVKEQEEFIPRESILLKIKGDWFGWKSDQHNIIEDAKAMSEEVSLLIIPIGVLKKKRVVKLPLNLKIYDRYFQEYEKVDNSNQNDNIQDDFNSAQKIRDDKEDESMDKISLTPGTSETSSCGSAMSPDLQFIKVKKCSLEISEEQRLEELEEEEENQEYVVHIEEIYEEENDKPNEEDKEQEFGKEKNKKITDKKNSISGSGRQVINTIQDFKSLLKNNQSSSPKIEEPPQNEVKDPKVVSQEKKKEDCQSILKVIQKQKNHLFSNENNNSSSPQQMKDIFKQAVQSIVKNLSNDITPISSILSFDNNTNNNKSTYYPSPQSLELDQTPKSSEKEAQNTKLGFNRQRSQSTQAANNRFSQNNDSGKLDHPSNSIAKSPNGRTLYPIVDEENEDGYSKQQNQISHDAFKRNMYSAKQKMESLQLDYKKTKSIKESRFYLNKTNNQQKQEIPGTKDKNKKTSIREGIFERRERLQTEEISQQSKQKEKKKDEHINKQPFSFQAPKNNNLAVYDPIEDIRTHLQTDINSTLARRPYSRQKVTSQAETFQLPNIERQQHQNSQSNQFYQPKIIQTKQGISPNRTRRGVQSFSIQEENQINQSNYLQIHQGSPQRTRLSVSRNKNETGMNLKINQNQFLNLNQFHIPNQLVNATGTLFEGKINNLSPAFGNQKQEKNDLFKKKQYFVSN